MISLSLLLTVYSHIFIIGSRLFSLSVIILSVWFGNLPLESRAQQDYVSITSDKTIKIDKHKGTALLEGHVVVLQESTGSTLMSDELMIQRDNQTNETILIRAKGNVRSSINQQDTASGLVRTVEAVCRFAEVDRLANTVVLQREVVIKSHDFKITADSVFYDLNKELGTINEIPGKQVTINVVKSTAVGEAKMSDASGDSQLIDGAADEIRVYKLLRKMTLQGNIRFYDQAEEARFTANRADVYFDELEKLERIVAYQNVEISQPQRVSRADRAVFDYQTDTIVLTGNASVKEENQLEINSSTITMHMNENQGIISGDDTVPVRAKVRISP